MTEHEAFIDRYSGNGTGRYARIDASGASAAAALLVIGAARRNAESALAASCETARRPQ